MAADRQVPTIVTDPSDITGEDYATEVSEEVDQLYVGVITQTQTVGGTADAITAVSIPPLIAAAANGQTFRLTPGANNTSTVTVNLDARGAIALKDCDGNALSADDIISGRPIEFYRHGASGDFRLTQPTQRALIAALAASIDAANSAWEQFGDTTVSSPVTQIEHTFTAGEYSRVMVVFSAVSPDSGGSSTVTTLRHSGGAIVTLTLATNPGGTGHFLTGRSEFIIDDWGATKYHYGVARAWHSNLSELTDAQGASNATAPDRVRFEIPARNMDAGRVRSYGLRG